jgi:hypothetical protein
MGTFEGLPIYAFTNSRIQKRQGIATHRPRTAKDNKSEVFQK